MQSQHKAKRLKAFLFKTGVLKNSPISQSEGRVSFWRWTSFYLQYANVNLDMNVVVQARHDWRHERDESKA